MLVISGLLAMEFSVRECGEPQVSHGQMAVGSRRAACGDHAPKQRQFSSASVYRCRALRLARYFNTTAQFWLNLQSSFDPKQTEIDVGRKIEKEVHPMAQAA